MRKELLKYIVCPKCRSDLALAAGEEDSTGHVQQGRLSCTACRQDYPIEGSIPRFVPMENYAASFGLQWNRYALTQFDLNSGITLSKKRFDLETKFGDDLRGQLVLEAGSGSGRFTEIACQTGATVISFDYSNAVDANARNNGQLPNLHLLQASIFEMPFRDGLFDKVFCLGVLQHTPDPPGAFQHLLRVLKPGGRIAIDVYKKTLGVYLAAKYWVRPVTTRIAPDRLYRMTRRYIDFMWPLANLLRRLPRGTWLNWGLNIPDYSYTGLAQDKLKEWAYLDAFDMLAPKYDIPQRLERVQTWFRDAGLDEVEVHYGYNGIEGRGRKGPS